MIFLTNGHLQNASNMAVPNGSMSLQLNVDATVVASPYGIVSADIPVTFQFDGNGDIVAPAQIWSNLELNPQNNVGLGTYYLVTFYDQNGARLNRVPMWWQFTQSNGATVDIGQVIPFATIGGNVIFYPLSFTIPAPTPSTLGGVFSTTGAGHQWISAIETNGSVALSQPAFSDISGTLSAAQLPSPLVLTSFTASGLITAQAGIQVGLNGTVSGQVTLEGSTSGGATITAPAVAGTSTNPIAVSNSLNIPSGTVFSINADTGISRASAGVLDIGNGTAGNASGTVNAAAYQVAGTAIAASNLSNGVTGTGSVVLAASPTLTGTLSAAAITASGIVQSASLQLGAPASGPAITFGSGAPAGSAVNGSLYINTAGAHGTVTLLYVYNTATTAWVGIA